MLRIALLSITLVVGFAANAQSIEEPIILGEPPAVVVEPNTTVIPPAESAPEVAVPVEPEPTPVPPQQPSTVERLRETVSNPPLPECTTGEVLTGAAIGGVLGAAATYVGLVYSPVAAGTALATGTRFSPKETAMVLSGAVTYGIFGGILGCSLGIISN